MNEFKRVSHVESDVKAKQITELERLLDFVYSFQNENIKVGLCTIIARRHGVGFSTMIVIRHINNLPFRSGSEYWWFNESIKIDPNCLAVDWYAPRIEAIKNTIKILKNE